MTFAFAFALLLGLTADPIPQVQRGHVERLQNLEFNGVASRQVHVWLPEGYPADGPYASVYFQDGQMAFDSRITWNQQSWRAAEIADELIRKGGTRPFIIVAIANAGPLRGSEYLPQKAFESLSDTEQARQLAAQRPGGALHLLQAPHADAYLAFLVSHLIPRVEQDYAVARTPDQRLLIGSSMGGLISLYALSRYPEVFGAAASLSTHWPGGFLLDDPVLPTALLDWFEANLPEPGQHRFYFDLGSIGLDAYYQPWQARLDAFAQRRGFTESDWMSRVYAGSEHSERAWSERLHIVLQFLLPAERPDAADESRH